MKDIIDEVNGSYGLTNEIILNLDDKLDLSKSSIAAMVSKVSGVYYVKVTSTEDKKLNEILKTHEYGHIYHGHLDDFEYTNDQLIKIIENNKSNLESMINKECDIDYADKLLDSVLKDRSTNMLLHNIAMDLEVNSTVLDEDDIEYIKGASTKIVESEMAKLSSEFGDKEIDEKDQAKLAKILVNLMNCYEMKGVHPNNYNFSPGLRYQDYLVKCIMNLPVVLKDFMNKNKKYVKGENGEGGKIEKLGSRMPKTMEEFKEMMDNLVEAEGDVESDDEDQQNNGQSQQSDKKGKNGKGQSSDSDESDKKDGDGSSNGKNKSKDGKKSKKSPMDHDSDEREDYYGNSGSSGSDSSDGIRGGRGLNPSTTVRDYHVNNDPLDLALSDILNDCRNKVIKRRFLRDFTYKYNRKMLGNSKMLNASYRQKVAKDDDPTIVFCVDVSGSMETDLVDRVITTIRSNMKKIDRSLRYSVAAWDTRLQQYYKDIDCNTPIPKLSCLGGTRLAGMFDLFKEEYDKNAILVMVSDFDDDLDEWREKESKLNGYSMYGICYGGSGYGRRNIPEFKNLKVKIV